MFKFFSIIVLSAFMWVQFLPEQRGKECAEMKLNIYF